MSLEARRIASDILLTTNAEDENDDDDKAEGESGEEEGEAGSADKEDGDDSVTVRVRKAATDKREGKNLPRLRWLVCVHCKEEFHVEDNPGDACQWHDDTYSPPVSPLLSTFHLFHQSASTDIRPFAEL